MRHHSIAFGLLLALAFGVMTAASPCAVGVPHQAPPAPARASSCHDGGMVHHHPSPASPARGASRARHRGCCDPTDGDPRVCQSACQVIAVLVYPATPVALERRIALARPPAERSSSLFVAAIDHIPLA